MPYPRALLSLITLLEELPEQERRETLVAYAERAKNYEPKPDELFDLQDVRKDEECTDTVGVFLSVDATQRARFRISLGPEVQTLTRAMATILCKGLEGSTPEEIVKLPPDFVPKMVGAQLVRARSQTVYYMLTRMKNICRQFIARSRV